jgi:nucleoside-diphosphate-sugar epimerase
MKTALVTGAAGFIGRHASRALADAGYTVHGIDIVRTPGVMRWDARDFFRADEGGYDVVVHAAAVVGGRAKIDGDPLALAVNFELDAALFQWAARTRPGRVVYISSSAAYPVMLQTWDDARPLRESAVTLHEPIVGLPDALYGWSKLTGEILAARAREAGIPVTVIRPFSGYGEDQNADEYPFPAFAARALAREDPFVIWSSGDQVRDWIHVDDICAALMIMIRDGIDGPVNLGTGRATSMRELARAMCLTAGYDPEFKVLPGKPSGVAYRVADVTRMNEFFKPAVSLEDGIERAIKKRM